MSSPKVSTDILYALTRNVLSLLSPLNIQRRVLAAVTPTISSTTDIQLKRHVLGALGRAVSSTSDIFLKRRIQDAIGRTISSLGRSAPPSPPPLLPSPTLPLPSTPTPTLAIPVKASVLPVISVFGFFVVLACVSLLARCQSDRPLQRLWSRTSGFGNGLARGLRKCRSVLSSGHINCTILNKPVAKLARSIICTQALNVCVGYVVQGIVENTYTRQQRRGIFAQLLWLICPVKVSVLWTRRVPDKIAWFPTSEASFYSVTYFRQVCENLALLVHDKYAMAVLKQGLLNCIVILGQLVVLWSAYRLANALYRQSGSWSSLAILFADLVSKHRIVSRLPPVILTYVFSSAQEGFIYGDGPTPMVCVVSLILDVVEACCICIAGHPRLAARFAIVVAVGLYLGKLRRQAISQRMPHDLRDDASDCSNSCILPTAVTDPDLPLVHAIDWTKLDTSDGKDDLFENTVASEVESYVTCGESCELMVQPIVDWTALDTTDREDEVSVNITASRLESYVTCSELCELMVECAAVEIKSNVTRSEPCELVVTADVSPEVDREDDSSKLAFKKRLDALIEKNRIIRARLEKFDADHRTTMRKIHAGRVGIEALKARRRSRETSMEPATATSPVSNLKTLAKGRSSRPRRRRSPSIDYQFILEPTWEPRALQDIERRSRVPIPDLPRACELGDDMVTECFSLTVDEDDEPTDVQGAIKDMPAEILPSTLRLGKQLPAFADGPSPRSGLSSSVLAVIEEDDSWFARHVPHLGEHGNSHSPVASLEQVDSWGLGRTTAVSLGRTSHGTTLVTPFKLAVIPSSISMDEDMFPVATSTPRSARSKGRREHLFTSAGSQAA